MRATIFTAAFVAGNLLGMGWTNGADAQVQTPPGVQQPGNTTPGLDVPGEVPTPHILPTPEDTLEDDLMPPLEEPGTDTLSEPSFDFGAGPQSQEVPDTRGIYNPEEDSPFMRFSPQAQPGDAFLPGNQPAFQQDRSPQMLDTLTPEVYEVPLGPEAAPSRSESRPGSLPGTSSRDAGAGADSGTDMNTGSTMDSGTF